MMHTVAWYLSGLHPRHHCLSADVLFLLFLSFSGVNVSQEMGKNEFARTLTGSDSGYGDDVSERNSSSSLHPLCKSIRICYPEETPSTRTSHEYRIC